MIETVVFDMDDVLCRYRIERRLELLAGWSGRSPDAIFAAIWRSGFEDEAERGACTADAYLQEFGARIGYPLSVAEWVRARRVATEPDEAMLAIARRVGAERPVAMFTNNPLLLKRHIGEVFPAVPEIFGERAVFSAELGCRKPEPEAFRRLAGRLGVPPRACCSSTTMPTTWPAPARRASRRTGSKGRPGSWIAWRRTRSAPDERRAA